MPRLFDEDNEPLDFCKGCFPNENTAVIKYGCTDYDTEHPDYDYEAYACERCGIRLRSKDNHIE